MSDQVCTFTREHTQDGISVVHTGIPSTIYELTASVQNETNLSDTINYNMVQDTVRPQQKNDAISDCISRPSFKLEIDLISL